MSDAAAQAGGRANGDDSRSSGVRLAELVATLSLGVDLGLGQPMEHCLRSTVLALRLGETLGQSDEERAETYYVSLLAWVCCHADAYEQAFWFGDEIELHAATYGIDMAGGLPLMAFLLRRVGSGLPPLERARRIGSFLTGGTSGIEGSDVTHCVLAGTFAEQLGLGPAIRDQLLQAFERWDGKGAPKRLHGDEIGRPVRIMQLAEIAEVFHRLGGVEAASEVARKRRGTQFDPVVVDLFCERAPDVLANLDPASGWAAIIERIPGLAARLSNEQLDRALRAVADFVDLKSPYTAGHSHGVANLATAAAHRFGLAARDAREVRWAALLHELGRLGVPNAIWDKTGPLTAAEVERVRLVPYLTERMLSACAALAPPGVLAGLVHERLDGSGYPRNLHGDALPRTARLLAAADVYHALIEPRPHRAALPTVAAAAELRAEAKAGRLDGYAVDAVLKAAGHRIRGRPERPGGLTPREVEVLKLLARGHSNKQIAAELVVTPKTVANHVEHIYSKAGVSSRAAATLFATQHGLLGTFGRAGI